MIIETMGKSLSIDFGHASQGFRLWASEWDGRQWQYVDGYDGVLCIMATHFDALCGVAQELWGDSVHGETLAQALGVDMVTYDEEEWD